MLVLPRIQADEAGGLQGEMDFINGGLQLTNMHMHFSTVRLLNSQVGLWLGKREVSYPTCGATVNAGWAKWANR